ncbi:hypothetical protein D3C72_966230 [compost metagenome]
MLAPGVGAARRGDRHARGPQRLRQDHVPRRHPHHPERAAPLHQAPPQQVHERQAQDDHGLGAGQQLRRAGRPPLPLPEHPRGRGHPGLRARADQHRRRLALRHHPRRRHLPGDPGGLPGQQDLPARRVLGHPLQGRREPLPALDPGHRAGRDQQALRAQPARALQLRHADQGPAPGLRALLRGQGRLPPRPLGARGAEQAPDRRAGGPLEARAPEARVRHLRRQAAAD